MRASALHLSAIAVGVAALPAAAVESTMTSAGFTGLGITPNAQLLEWGRAEASYERQLPGIPRRSTGLSQPSGHNYVLGFGLLPNLEVSGRLATNNFDANCFRGCGVRDLSAAGKVSIGLDTANRFRIAAGATDVGGAVTYFRTYYGVLTFDSDAFQTSLGIAKRSGTGIQGSRSPLHGPFASAAWQPTPLVRGHVEYSDGNAWAGVRIFAPKEWLPNAWSLSVGANVRVTGSNLTDRSWLGATLSIPLYSAPAPRGTGQIMASAPQTGQPALPSPEPARAQAQSAVTPRDQRSATAAAQAPVAPVARAALPTTDEQLMALAKELEDKGLEDIWIGRVQDGAVAVRANNGTYRWNSADALGAALGAVARTLGDSRAGYRLVLTQRQVPLVAVTGQADCLREWIMSAAVNCTAGELSTPGTMLLDSLHEGATWLVRARRPSWQTLRVAFSPVLRTTAGTEYGAFDYSLGVNVNAQLPLWAGASVDAGMNAPLASSDNFREAAIFAQRRVKTEADRLAFTQTLRLPLERWVSGTAPRGEGALTGQLVVGRIGTYYDGGLGSVRWEPGEGRHRFSVDAGLFRNNSFDTGFGPLGTLRRANPILGSYRYSFMPTRTDVEVIAGQFMNNDRGFQAGMRQWFGDTAMNVYYKRSAFSGQRVRQLIGVSLSFPIGPRRDWRPTENLQFGGTSRFTHGLETTVREPTGGNPIATGHGVRPPTPGLDATFNSDRSGLAWFEDNLRRIRDAAR
jgi:hypothetical protein